MWNVSLKWFSCSLLFVTISQFWLTWRVHCCGRFRRMKEPKCSPPVSTKVGCATPRVKTWSLWGSVDVAMMHVDHIGFFCIFSPGTQCFLLFFIGQHIFYCCQPTSSCKQAAYQFRIEWTVSDTKIFGWQKHTNSFCWILTIIKLILEKSPVI